MLSLSYDFDTLRRAICMINKMSLQEFCYNITIFKEIEDYMTIIQQICYILTFNANLNIYNKSVKKTIHISKPQQISTHNKMINQITCNSNNAIQLSRGQLLNWLNNLLKLNYSKIQQLGTGAAYCQLLDLIYPGKVPLSKINWKAKFDYEYLNNFKVLQQSFTKLNIMKHIDVEKLVKCKYQDNLQFLQWFKKIFDSTGSSGSNKDYDPVTRRGGQVKIQKQKQNKNPVPLLHSQSYNQQMQYSKQGSKQASYQSYNSSYENSKPSTDRNMQKEGMQSVQGNSGYRQEFMRTTLIGNSVNGMSSTQNFGEMKSMQNMPPHISSSQKPNKFQLSNPCNQKVDEKLINLFTQNQNQQKQYYLKKIKQIQYLMDTWNLNKSSQSLIQNIRKIILAKPQTVWNVEDGQYVQLEDRQKAQEFGPAEGQINE